jgi:phage shock protein A
MTKPQQDDFLTRFRDLSSEALNRLSEVPGGSKLMEMANDTRSRLDEMQKRLRGLDELEKRVDALEREVAKLSGRKPPSAARAGSASKTAAPRKASSASASKPATPKKPPA